MNHSNKKVDELLSVWERERAGGLEPVLEDLCAESPEYLPELRNKIEALKRFDSAPETFNIGGESTSQRENYEAALSRDLPDIPGYELQCVIGQGGMGIVYEARNLSLNRTVALKTILTHGGARLEQLARFRAEANAIAKLQHPNIVQIYEIGEVNGVPYCALEYVDGGTLASQFGGKSLDPLRAAEIMEPVARAIYAAHQRGIIHRDLKPGNILLSREGIPKVTDFGLAKDLQSGSDWNTRTGVIMGTPAYMSPEQASGKNREVGIESDVYSLGAVLYALVTGRPPFQSSSLTEVLRQVAEVDPASPRQFNLKVTRDLETIILKCLQKDRRRRYPSALELADELQRVRSEIPILARPISRTETLLRWMRQAPMTTSFVLLFLLSSLLGLGVSSYFASVANLRARLAKSNEVSATLSAAAATRSAHESEVRRLAAEARLASARHPQRGLLLAIAANEEVERYGKIPFQAAEQTARDLLSQDWSQSAAQLPSVPVKLAIPAGEDRLLVVAEDGFAYEWPFADGQLLGAPLRTRVSSKPLRSLELGDAAKRLAIADDEGIIHILEHSESGLQRLATLDRPEAAIDKSVALRGVVRLTLSSDASRLAATYYTGETWWWDLSVPPPVAHRLAPREAARDPFDLNSWPLVTAFSKDGRKLLSTRGKEAFRWNLDDANAPPVSLNGHADIVSMGFFTPDGQWLVTGSHDKTIRFWDPAQPLHTEPVHAIKAFGSGSNLSLAFFRDRRSVVTAGGPAGVLRLPLQPQDFKDRVEVFSLDGQTPTAICLSPDEKWLAACAEHRIFLWNLKRPSPSRPRIVVGHDMPIVSLAISADSRWLFSLGQDRSLRVVPLSDHAIWPGDLRLSSDVVGLSVDEEKMDLLAAGFRRELVAASGDAAQVWREKSRTSTAGTIASLHVSENRAHAAVIQYDGCVEVFALPLAANAEAVIRHMHGTTARGCAFGADGRWFASMDCGGCIFWNDLRGGERASRTLDCKSSIPMLGLFPHPERDAILAVAADGSVTEFKIKKDGIESSGRPVILSPGATMYVAAYMDGRRLALSHESGLTFKSLSGVEEVRKLEVHEALSTGAVFSPHAFLRASVDGNVIRYPRDSNGLPAASQEFRSNDSPSAYQKAIGVVTESTDGRWLASGGVDGGIRIWDLKTTQPEKSKITLYGHGAAVISLDFASNNKLLIAGDRSGLVRTWDLDAQKMIKYAKKLVGRELTLEERAEFGLTR